MSIGRIIVVFLLQFTTLSAFCQKNADEVLLFQRKIYLGVLGGYGSTTWDGLVPSKKNANGAMTMSTPIKVEEGGSVWGGMIGYELFSSFALEANYTRYADARVHFDPFSIFTFDYDGKEEFNTRTEAFSLMGKVMFVIPDTRMRLYSSFGLANVHRSDMLLDQWRVSPSFGVGVNYHLNQHVMAELGGNYIAGFGESQLNPTNSYMPFLYSVTFRLAYFL